MNLYSLIILLQKIAVSWDENVLHCILCIQTFNNYMFSIWRTTSGLDFYLMDYIFARGSCVTIEINVHIVYGSEVGVGLAMAHWWVRTDALQYKWANIHNAIRDSPQIWPSSFGMLYKQWCIQSGENSILEDMENIHKILAAWSRLWTRKWGSCCFQWKGRGSGTLMKGLITWFGIQETNRGAG